jgi:hypothetical protein
MRKVTSIRILSLMLVGFTCSRCSDEIPIMNDHPTVPVVYAQIDPYDTINYVRVGRTFQINEKEDWVKLVRDSLEFDKVEVFILGKRGDQIVWRERFFETSAIKDTGFFPPGDYQVFELDHKLPINITGRTESRPGVADIDSLILEVKVPELEMITRAKIKLLNPVIMINYKSRYEIYVYGGKPSVYAITDPGEFPARDFQYVYQQIDFTVHYTEHFSDRNINKTVHWLANTGWDDNAYFINPERLFNPMLHLISEDSTVLFRTLDGIDISLLRTSKILNSYLYIKDIWENTDFPPFTNFDKSYGLFFAITRDGWKGMQLFSQSLDSLCLSPFYRSMKFRRQP